MSPSKRQRRRDFDARVQQFWRRNIEAEQAQWDNRVRDLVSSIAALRQSGYSPKDIRILAEERASIEQFARQRMCLPRSGLKELIPELLRYGFLFGDINCMLVLTYFPDGWRIVPAEMEGGYGSPHAYLVSPTGVRWAFIFYMDSCTGHVLEARITKL